MCVVLCFFSLPFFVAFFLFCLCFFVAFLIFFFFLFLAAEAPQTFNNNTGRGGGERAGQSDGAMARHQTQGHHRKGAEAKIGVRHSQF